MSESTGDFRCFSCGRWCKEVVYGGPTADEAGQCRRWASGVLRVAMDEGPYRATVACWVCFWKTDPDMWIHAEHWDALKPIIPASKLPLLLEFNLVTFAHDDPASYPWPGEAL